MFMALHKAMLNYSAYSTEAFLQPALPHAPRQAEAAQNKKILAVE